MKGRTFKLSGNIKMPDNNWDIERIEKEFQRMLKEEANIQFNGKLEEINE